MSSASAPQRTTSNALKQRWVLSLSIVLVAVIWSYLPTLIEMGMKWESDPQYSHGYLVPLFVIALLWIRRDQLKAEELRPNYWGIPLLLMALGLRLFGAFYHYLWFDAISIVPTLLSLAFLLGGAEAWKWSWPALLFTVFMVPLPFSVEQALREPLRNIGTVTSTYVLQTIGLPAVSEGNVIIISEGEEEHRLGVEEACSGLRMLVIFFALSTAVAILSERPLWERIFIIFCAIPIALISNIIRITATGILYVTVNAEVAKMVFHDLAGWLMMPLALAMLWLLNWILTNLFIDEQRLNIRLGLGSSKGA
ncbi:MAG: exosortase/archaeosortase family protein [Planctomycetaceae bacterium]